MANASIYGMVGQGVRSPLEYAGDFQRLQAGQQAAEANKLALMLQQQKADEYGRGLEAQNKLRGITSGFGQDDSANVQALYQGGFLGEAQDYAKNVAGRQKDKAAADKDIADTAAKQYDTQRKKFEHRIQGLSQFTDPQGAKQWLAESVMNGALTMQEAQQMVAKVPTDPAAFAQWRDASVMSLMDAGKQAGFIKPDANATLSAQTSAANAKLADERIRSEGAANRGVQMRGQNIAQSTALQGGTVQLGADGSMLMVPNKFTPGQAVTASPVLSSPGGAPVKGASKDGSGKISSEVQRQIGGVMDFDKSLAALETALEDFNPRGTDQFNLEKRAKISSIAKQAQLSAKEAAALGALTGPDMALIEGILADPSSVRGAVAGSKGLKAQITEARAGNKRRVQTLGEQYGEKATAGMSADLRGSQPTSGNLSAAEAAELEQLRKMFPGRK